MCIAGSLERRFNRQNDNVNVHRRQSAKTQTQNSQIEGRRECSRRDEHNAMTNTSRVDERVQKSVAHSAVDFTPFDDIFNLIRCVQINSIKSDGRKRRRVKRFDFRVRIFFSRFPLNSINQMNISEMRSPKFDSVIYRVDCKHEYADVLRVCRVTETENAFN